jgi:TPR repeat protein
MSRLLDPSSTLAIILGAYEWSVEDVPEAPSFRRSAAYFRDYLVKGLALDPDLIVDLFNDSAPASTQLKRIRNEIWKRVRERATEGHPIKDVLIYYVGHGTYDNERHLHFLVRDSEKGIETETSIAAQDLAKVLCVAAPHQRRLYVLDCCHSEAALSAFGAMAGGLDDAVASNALEELTSADPAPELDPECGTLLLCACPKKESAIGKPGDERTLFTGALLSVLANGCASVESEMLSFSNLPKAIYKRMLDKYKTPPHPVLHQPDQRAGDLLSLPAFPNTAYVASARRVKKKRDQKPPPVSMGDTPSPPPVSDTRNTSELPDVVQNGDTEAAIKVKDTANEGHADGEDKAASKVEDTPNKVSADATSMLDRIRAKLQAIPIRVKLLAVGAAGVVALLVVIFAFRRSPPVPVISPAPFDKNYYAAKESDADDPFKLKEAANRYPVIPPSPSSEQVTPAPKGTPGRIPEEHEPQVFNTPSSSLRLQQNVNDLYDAAKKGDPAAWSKLKDVANRSDATAETQFYVADIYYYNVKDYHQAATWYEKASKQGSIVSQYNLGIMYYEGTYYDERGVPQQNDTKAVDWFRLAADNDYAAAQVFLGWMYQQGRGVSQQSDTEAVKWYQQAANKGSAHAQNNLGWMYQQGRGVSQSDATAVNLYQQAADKGDADAQNNLGWMYEHGWGVSQSDATAVNLYQQAAKKGNAYAQNNLGRMYQQGRGVPQSDATAVNWYQQAADKGDADAQTNLGWMYQKGRGVPQSDTTAMDWYRQAAKKGNARAQYNLGVMYAAGGLGVPRDDTQAVFWYRKAANQGNADAKTALDAMRAQGRVTGGP